MAHYKRKRSRTVGGHRYSSKALEYRLKLDAQDLRWLQSYPRWHDKLFHTRPARRRATFVAHTNSSKLMLRDEVWEEAGVEDVTRQLVAAMP